MDEVKKLLECIGLVCYVPKFEEEGWDDLETVLSMSENDIKTCIPKAGHARRLYNKIQKVLSERKEGNTVEKTVRPSSPVIVREVGSHEDGSTTFEALIGNESKVPDLDKGKTQPDTTLQETEKSKVKCDRAAKSEADSLGVQEETHEDYSKVDRLTGPAKHNLVASREDILLAQTRETCDEVCRKEEDISQPIQDWCAALQRIPRESLSICGEEMKTYRGDMPLCTYVSDSENITIAKNVKIQHFKSGQSKYKGQIESVLDSIEEKHQKLFVETRALAEVNDILDDRFWAVIKGNAGEGKTTMGYHLLRQHREKGYEPIIVTTVDDWKNLVDGKRNENEKQFVLIDDIFGTISVDERKVSDWASLFEMIDKLLTERKGDLKVVCTVRRLIYSEVETKVSRFKCFQKLRIIDISDKQFALQEEEKSKMLDKYLEFYNIELDVFEIKQINADQHSHGFPHCLEMFCTNSSLRKRGLGFFLNPLKMLENEFENLYESDKNKFCALVMLVVATIKNIQISFFSDDDQKESLLETAGKLSKSPVTSLQDINLAFSHLKNTYIKVSDDDIISFCHPSFYEMVSIVITGRNPVVAVDVLDIKFLTFRTQSHRYKQNMLEDFVSLPKACNKNLVNRFSEALLLPYMDVLRHDAWDDTDFIKLWISHVTQNANSDKCLLAKLLVMEFLDFLNCYREFLMSLFALNKHEQIIIDIVQHQNLKQFWFTEMGILQLSQALVSASRSDCSVKLLKYLVQKGADINHISIIWPSGTVLRNALYYAVENNNFKNTRALLECGASDLFLSDTDSVFFVAFKHKNMTIITLLLNHLKIYQSCDATGNLSCERYLLFDEKYIMLLSSHLEMISDVSLLEPKKENQDFLKDVLCLLSNAGIILSERKLFDFMISTGSKENIEQVMETLNTNGFSFDHMWKSCDYAGIIKSHNPVELLEVFQRYGLNLCSRDVHGKALFHYMPYGKMRENDRALLNFLFRKDVNVDLPYQSGDIPLHIALRSFNPSNDCTDDLFKLIALSNACKSKDKTGKNCFHFLAMSRHTFSQDVLERLISILLLRGCDINEKDNEGTPPLHLCNLGLLKMFVEKGANPFLANNKKRTVAMEIIHRNELNALDMLSILCNCGLDLTMTDENKRNLLHYVGTSTYSNVVKEQLFDFLLSKGVGINEKDIINITPLMTVVQNPKSTMRFVYFTIKSGASVTEKDDDNFTMFHHCIRGFMAEHEKNAIFDNLLKKDISVDMTDLLKLAMEFADMSIIYTLMNKVSLPIDVVFDISKSVIHSNRRTRIYPLYSLLVKRYSSGFMDIFGKDKDFQKALLRDICMHNYSDCNLFELFPNGINVEWLNDANAPYQIYSNKEIIRKFIFCQNEGSLEYNLVKMGQFEMLFFLVIDNDRWIVSENELPEILQGLALCTREHIAELLLKTLFIAKENCSFDKSIRYSTLKTWCKQPHLHLSCIKLLLAHGDTGIVDEKDESLVFCVIQHFLQHKHNLIMFDYTDLVMELIKFNFKCDVPNTDGVTPLMLLISNGDIWYETLVDLLISKSENLSQKDNKGCNILHYLVLSGIRDEQKANLLRKLIEKGVPVIENKSEKAPFHLIPYSRNKCSISTIKCFLQCDIRKHYLVNLIQYQIAFISGNFEISRQLIKLFEESKLDAKTDVDITGSTFLAQSARWLSPALVSYFIQKGTDTNKTDILDFSAVHRIIFSDLLFLCASVIGKGMYFGVDAYAEQMFNMHAFPPWNSEVHSACFRIVNDALDCLRILLEQGADPNIMDVNGKTPLHYCADSALFDAFICPAMRLLISHGADVNREDFEGRTPLMLCLQFEKSKYRRLTILIRAKASFSTEDYDCGDIFHYAQKGIGKRLCWLLDKEHFKARLDG